MRQCLNAPWHPDRCQSEGRPSNQAASHRSASPLLGEVWVDSADLSGRPASESGGRMRILSEVLTGARACPPECATCERLRGAAAAAVLMAGGAQVTMADLAAAAGVPASAVAGHCPEGAARIVADAYRRASGELFTEYAASFRLADSWPEKLGAALERMLRRLAQEPAIAHLCFVTPVAGGEELREIRETFRDAVRRAAGRRAGSSRRGRGAPRARARPRADGRCGVPLGR